MYSISSNSPLFRHEDLVKASQSISEATNQKWVDTLTVLYNSGKTKISDITYVLEMNEKQLRNILSQMEHERLVATTNNTVDLTSKGREYVKKENPMLESHRKNSVPMVTKRLTARAIPKQVVKEMSRGYKEITEEEMMKNNVTDAYMAKPKSGAKIPFWYEIQLSNKHSVYYVDKGKEGVSIEVYDLDDMVDSIDAKRVKNEETEVTESISTDQMMDYVEQLLYLIMSFSRDDSAELKDIERENQTAQYSIPEKNMPAVLAKAEQIGFLKQKGSKYELTKKAKDFIRMREESVESDSDNEITEAPLRDRDFEVKNNKVYISKRNYKKVDKDSKTTENGKPMMMAMGPKGTTLYPVEFTESKDLTEAKKNQVAVYKGSMGRTNYILVNPKTGLIQAYTKGGTPLSMSNFTFMLPAKMYTDKGPSHVESIEKAIKDRVIKGNEKLYKVLSDLTKLKWEESK